MGTTATVRFKEQTPSKATCTYLGVEQDRLFEADYEHLGDTCINCDPSRLVKRLARLDNSPMVYYGTIASGDQVMKHGTTRDLIAKELGVLCFEMEAAGLMDKFPSLVIRGICDYADSHKTKECTPTSSGSSVDDELETTQQRRLLLLASLEFEKNIGSRHEGIRIAYAKTCQWLLQQPDYTSWQNDENFSDHHGFLWISGKPGAGKSTIMKFLVICFIDALDECPEDQVREMLDFFQELGQRAVLSETRMHTCFSSRHYPHIDIKNGVRLTLEAQAGHAKDLEEYVRTKLENGDADSPQAIDIVKQILQKASGVFMWAVLVVEILNKEYQRGRIFAVQRRLDTIPEKLGDLFKGILTRDNENMDDLRLCIQWILFSRRPLKLKEYYFALASGLETDDALVWDSSRTPQKIMELFVLSSSKGLAETTATSKAMNTDPTVQFIHEGANVHSVYVKGCRPLHLAIRMMHSAQESVQLLLEKGADVNCQQDDGMTALHLAAQRGEHSVVETLLGHGADPDLGDKRGKTALSEAINHAVESYPRRSQETILSLVRGGAELDTRSPEGLDIRAWALQLEEKHPGIGILQSLLAVREDGVGWVCALPKEMTAARLMLDDLHESLAKIPGDENTYTFGNIRDHNIVIACLPSGQYGITSAAIVAENMRRSFPSIKVRLMVGIGGGAPDKNDVRLGDVVVSHPTATSSGVVPYNFGKTVQAGRFERTGVLNKPPRELLAVVAKLRSDDTSLPDRISATLGQLQERDPSPGPFTKPPDDIDRLFDAAYDHIKGEDTCAKCDASKLLERPRRPTDHPKIHYGVVASADQVMKHGLTRRQLADDHDPLCFEMEAAGLMDSFPCLVIRGICDYSDSHKAKTWQEYAAATAAADLFEDILTRDNDNMEDLLLSIQWILFGKRPLNREEYYFALLSGLSTSEALQSLDKVPAESMEPFVVSSSKGLAETISTNTHLRIVQFIHESVRDFLLKDGGLRKLWPDLGEDFENRSHDRLKTCCLVYLNKVDISARLSKDNYLLNTPKDDSKRIKKIATDDFEFLDYATNMILHHADAAAETVPQDAFFMVFPLDQWVKLNNILEAHKIRRLNPNSTSLNIH
ncbi:putative ankyrin repeat protein, partial [Colletotrichum shisoi]